MDIFDLFAKLSLDSSQFEKGIEDSERKTRSFASKLGSGLKTAAKVGVAAIGAVTTAAGVLTKTILNGTKEVASYGDNIDKASQKLGFSAEAYQEWDAVLQHSGASIDSLQRGMTTLSKAAENGSDAFTRLGLSQKEVANMNQEELFGAVIERLQGMEAGTERAAIASTLLGGSAKELGALLNTSAEETEAMKKRVHELGGVLSNEAVKSAADYQDKLQDLQTSISGIKRRAVSEFLPAVTTVMDGLTDLFSGDENSGLGKINDGIEKFISRMSNIVPKSMEVVGKLATSIAGAVLDNIDKFIDAGAKLVEQLVTGVVKGLPKLASAAVKIVTAFARSISKNIGPFLSTVTDALLQALNILTDPDTIIQLIDAGVEMFIAFGNGIIKAVPRLIRRIPEIARNILTVVKREVPKLLSTIGQLINRESIRRLTDFVTSIISRIPSVVTDIANEFVNGISTFLPMVINSGTELIGALVDGLLEAIPSILDSVPKIIDAIVSAITTGFPKLVELASGMISTLVNGLSEKLPDYLPKVVGIIVGIVETISNNTGKLMEAAVSIVSALANAIVKVLPLLIEKVPTMIIQLIDALEDESPKLWKAAVTIVRELAKGIGQVWSIIKTKGVELVGKIWEGIKSKTFEILQWGVHIVKSIKRSIDSANEKLLDIGRNIVEGIWKGIKNAGSWLWGKIKGWTGDLVKSAKSALGISSPSKVFAEIGKFSILGFGEGFSNQFKAVSREVKEKMNELADQSVDFGADFSSDIPDYAFVDSDGEHRSGSALDRIYDLLQEILANMDFDIVLNDGAIAGRVDKLLGQEALRKARGSL